jgi:hypothetical protein
MKIIAHSQVPKDYTYSHLGYVSAAGYNRFVSQTLPRIIIGALVVGAAVIVLFKFRKRNNKK